MREAMKLTVHFLRDADDATDSRLLPVLGTASKPNRPTTIMTAMKNLLPANWHRQS